MTDTTDQTRPHNGGNNVTKNEYPAPVIVPDPDGAIDRDRDPVAMASAALVFGRRQAINLADVPADVAPYVTRCLAAISDEAERLYVDPSEPFLTVRHGRGFSVYGVSARPFRGTVTQCGDATTVAVRCVDKVRMRTGDMVRGEWRECGV